MQLAPHTIHIWIANLTITEELASKLKGVLSADEQAKADRFQFPIHRFRYIAAHYQLRQVLSLYTGTDPAAISFGREEHKKPYLLTPANSPLQFNLAHSGDIAIVGIGMDHQLGIDIEKVQDEYNLDVAKRFFSPEEYKQFVSLPENEKRFAYYRIWSRKEAMIKATGKGLTQSLPSFSVALRDVTENISLENQMWQLRPILIDAGYQAALACHPDISEIELHVCDKFLSI